MMNVECRIWGGGRMRHADGVILPCGADDLCGESQGVIDIFDIFA